ncbi:MAG: Mis12 domain-containing protein [Candidatus Thiodiazotropha endolucinida]|nr:Mis12 domain-containing protein [Candidatus Thiodiazotropha taylori]MCW4346118.1 Mis12 domain-containing protein [Candidatus Thiodiazotropha endolucinida]
MSSEHSCVTPAALQSKKRELTSPVFEIDTKKNKIVSVASSSEATEVIEHSDNIESEMTGEGSSMAEKTTSLVIPDAEMLKLSKMLKDTFKSEIVGLVNVIVDGVVDGLNEKIQKLEQTNKELSEENGLLKQRVETLERRVDQAEQYSRRNCLRISGVNETPTENTDDLILNLAADIGADIQLPDIDRSHRLGDRTKARSKPRDIIVKFATYRSRQNFYKKRTVLKQKGHTGVFVNEDLTKLRSSQLYSARKLVKSDMIKGAWSSDGNILIKDKSDKVHRVSAPDDLVQFGLPVMGPGQPEIPRHRRMQEFRPGAYVRATDRSFAEVTAGGSADMDHSGGQA